MIPKSYSVGTVFSFGLMWLSVTASFGIESVLDNPSCRETLSADEANKLRICMSRSDTCAKYWPNSSADLQDCRKTTAWIRAAMQWPENLQRELFGTTISTVPEPAWKQLKRMEIEGASPQFDLSKPAKANPYSKTTQAITPEAAKAAGFNPSILVGIIQTTGQVMQDKAALQDPEGSAAAKDVLKTVGLEDYAASDHAIQDGRQRAARAEMERQRVAAEQAARVKTAPIPSPPRSVTTTSERPYSTAQTVQSVESLEERKQRAEIDHQQALRSMGLPVASSDDRVAPKIGASPVQTTGSSRAGGFVTASPMPPPEPLKPLPPRVSPAAPPIEPRWATPAVRRAAPTSADLHYPFGVAPPTPILRSSINQQSTVRPPSNVHSGSQLDLGGSQSNEDLGSTEPSGNESSQYVQAMQERHRLADEERRHVAQQNAERERELELELEREQQSSCRTALAQVHTGMSDASSRWTGALQSLSGTLWWTIRLIDTTRAQCAGVEPEYSQLPELVNAAEIARAGCEKLTAGGGNCVPHPE